MGGYSPELGIPGQQDDSDAQVQQAAPQPSTGQPSATAGTPTATAEAGPKVSGRAMFLGNLLKTIMSGVQNAPGNPNNPFDRGFMKASPQAKQQASIDLSKQQSEADLAKMQVSLTGMKALQMEYMLKRLPQEDQMKTLQMISGYKDQLIKNGASVENTADDEKSADAQSMHLNSSDPRALNHGGKFYSMPHIDESGKPKWDVVYVPNKDTLQNDFDYTDADGNKQTLKAGTPMYGAMGKLVDSLHGQMSAATKAQLKMLTDSLKPNIPDAQINSTVGWLQSQLDQNTPLAQQNKNAIQAQINTLKAAHSQTQAELLAREKAKAQQKQEVGHDLLIATDKSGRQVAGTDAELKSKGIDTSTGIKMGAAEAEKVVTARTLVPQFDKALNLIDQLDKSGEIGVFASRFNKLAAQNVGEGDPRWAALLTQMGLNETALMQVHVGARGNSQLLEHFHDLANAGKMNAATLKAAINQERDYVKDKAMMPGTGGGGAGAGQGRAVRVNGKIVGYTQDGKTMTPVQ